MKDHKASGYICLWRCAFDNPIFRDDREPFDRFHAWVDLIALANHKDGKIMVGGVMIEIKRGQRFTSIRKLANRWHWSVHRVQRYIELLVNEEMITVEHNERGTLLTIVKYGFYNDSSNSERYSGGHTGRHSDGPQTIMNNNEKENKNPGRSPITMHGKVYEY